MLATLMAVPAFLILLLLQTAIVSTTPLLQGSADLIMLVIIAWTLQERVRVYWQWAIIGCFMLGFISESPLPVIFVAYLTLMVILEITRKKLWKAPYLTMWAMTFIGTAVVQGITLVGRWLEGAEISSLTGFNLIILPSLLLNLLLAAPIYSIMRDFANWLYPREMEV